MQLDRLRADHQLPRHVRVPERHGHRARHRHPVPAGLQHQPAADESKQKNRARRSLRAGDLLRGQQHRAVGVYRTIPLPGPLPQLRAEHK